ncbi:hypothetical protein K440DRAFT_554225 [Wilcoxina mikolae CBS 423.85]|nr:hypothetical protein K440DRAFT_554225 [Wilcoxina mikolae CBS 423.85]
MPGPPPPPPPPLDVSNLSIANGYHILSGKQEHYLKRELISRQVKFEINELNSPTALQRFGAPFQSPLGEVAPVDSELPILRYIFVNHVRNFPFLDQAREKEFWQDRLQVFLESFATKQISSSEDRLEETKRRKLALKCEKIVELMMNSGIPTASGYEERVSFDEIEAAGGADRNAQESALLANMPEGHWINGWDVNVASVRQTSVKRTLRYHTHAEFVLRVKRDGFPDVTVGRRYGAFAQLHRHLRNELPGKVLPPVPRKIKASQTTSSSFLSAAGAGSDDTSSRSSMDSLESSSTASSRPPTPQLNHKKSLSLGSSLAFGGVSSRNPSRTALAVEPQQPIRLWRENQRVSLRAFIRQLLEDNQVASSQAMSRFLLEDPIKLNEAEQIDVEQRHAMDEIRLEEQRQFYELARKRAQELDVYMESFRRDIVESNGLTKLFAEIRKKDKLADLDIQYRKFAEWLRIEVAATIYHLFLAEDNSAELFAQGKRIHSLIPYTILKNIIRITNPAAVMSGVLDLFLATPFKSRSLMQRVLGMAIHDGIRHIQKSVDTLVDKIGDPLLCEKLKAFTQADDNIKNKIRQQALAENMDLVVVVLQSEYLGSELEPKQNEKVFNAYVAYMSAVHNIHDEIKNSAQYFAYLKQLLKLYTRQRDKQMMQAMIEEPVTLQLFRDLFRIFYEPLVRVYKSANVYNSVTDFAVFVDDMILVIEQAQSQDMTTDPNKTVQSFIDLCQRHEDNFYKFVHEVHLHDDGLFDKLMGWLEGILEFLRHGPRSGAKLDMNRLFEEAVKAGTIDKDIAKAEIDALIIWQAQRRKWHQDKTRQKMASGDHGKNNRESWSTAPGGISPKDFGINDSDIESLADAEEYLDGDENEEDENTGDAIATERMRRQRHAEALKARAGEPVKPKIVEIAKLGGPFLDALRTVLAD